jgi:hypothetical protein
MALPIAGTWVVLTAPTRVLKLRLEGRDTHARLLCADVLDAQSKYTGQLGEIVDIAAGGNHFQHVATFHGTTLLGGETEARAIAAFIAQQLRPVGGAVE